MSAKTLSVILLMVLFLNRRMAVRAVVPVPTLLTFFDQRTHVSRIEISWSSSIFFVVVVDAKLVVVFDSDIARVDFENVEIQLLWMGKRIP